MVFGVAAEDVVRMSCDYKGKTYFLEREDDVWYMPGESLVALKYYRTVALVNGMTDLTVNQTIENVTGLEQYGLTQPWRIITFETDMESYTLYVGEKIR